MSPKTFENHRITHVINATCDHPNRFEDKGVKYLRVPVNDNMVEDLGPHFRKAVDFIGKCLFGNERLIMRFFAIHANKLYGNVGKVIIN